MTLDRRARLECLLDQLQQQLQLQGLWSARRPDARALASDQPFCVDTLTFAEWLQFIFIERLRTLLAQRAPLPEKCAVAPMASHCFSPQHNEPLIALLSQIDQTLSG